MGFLSTKAITDLKKKKHSSPTTTLHPRNIHQGNYDFSSLQQVYPELQPFVHRNTYQKWTIDFANPAAVLALNTALLKQHYQVGPWSVPPGYLCPPVPGRADYIHYVADLLGQTNGNKVPKGPQVRCLDLGTGASIIYPIIGIRCYGWSFLATEIDEKALAFAKKNQAATPFLEAHLQIVQQKDRHLFFKNILSTQDYIDLVVCNPPFYESAAQASEATTRKQRNLNQPPDPNRRNFGGQAHELWCPGGEQAFISKMIRESVAFAKNICWFTTLVAKERHLTQLQKELEQAKALSVKVIPMGQGSKRSRILAWTFLTPKQRKAWASYRWSKTNH